MNSARSAGPLPGSARCCPAWVPSKQDPVSRSRSPLSPVPAPPSRIGPPPSREPPRPRSSTGRRHGAVAPDPVAARCLARLDRDRDADPDHRGQHDRRVTHRAPRSRYCRFASSNSRRAGRPAPARHPDAARIHAGRNRSPSASRNSRRLRCPRSGIRLRPRRATRPGAGTRGPLVGLCRYRHGLCCSHAAAAGPLKPVRRRALASPIPTSCATSCRSHRRRPQPASIRPKSSARPARFADRTSDCAVGQRRVHPDSLWRSSFGS